MKKLFCFIILFIPWLISLFFIYPLNKISLIISLISISFYFFYTIYIFELIKNNKYKNILLYLCLFYITNQSFNIILFYYKNTLYSILLGVIMCILFFKTRKNT